MGKSWEGGRGWAAGLSKACSREEGALFIRQHGPARGACSGHWVSGAPLGVGVGRQPPGMDGCMGGCSC
jgi:hypothetical protein